VDDKKEEEDKQQKSRKDFTNNTETVNYSIFHPFHGIFAVIENIYDN
jgi:hypothetical protein